MNEQQNKAWLDLQGGVEGADPCTSLPVGLYSKICVAIGQASTCWSDPDDAGDFLSDTAICIANDLAREIATAYGEIGPRETIGDVPQ